MGSFGTREEWRWRRMGRYTWQDTANDRIQHFSATGAFLEKWGVEGTADGQFDSPYGIEVASDSTVHVVDWGNRRIQHFSASGTYLGKWGQRRAVPVPGRCGDRT